MRAPVKYIIAVVVFIPVFTSLVWTFGVPDSLIPKLINEGAAKKGYAVQAEGFKKGLLLSFRAGSLKVLKGKDELFTVSDLKGRISPLGLLTLKVGVVFGGYVGEGRLEGSAELLRKGYRLAVKFDDIEAEALPMARRVGNGYISGEADIRDGEGSVKFSVSEIELKKSPFPGVPLPPDIFKSAKGALTIEGDTVVVNSIFVEGRGLNARVSGRVKGDMLELKVELMPDEKVLPDFVMTALIGRYRVSAGYYVVPIKRRLRL